MPVRSRKSRSRLTFSTDVYASGCFHPFDSIYTGLGIGGNFFKTDNALTGRNGDAEIRDGNFNATRFMGSFVIGGGKVVNKIYGGIEALFDIM